MSRFHQILLPILVIAGAYGAQVCHGEDLYCGLDSTVALRDYPYPSGYELNVKFIYVAFRQYEGFDGCSGCAVDSVITYDEHLQIVSRFNEYLEAQSNGDLTLSMNSSLLLEPNVLLDAQHPTAKPWMANRSAQFYRAPETENPPTYLNYWAAEGIDDWYQSSEYVTELTAEILYKIWTVYQGFANPFSLPDEQKYDAIYIIWMTHDTPFRSFPHPVGGRPVIAVSCRANDETNNFFNVVPDQNWCIAGTSQVQNTSSWSAPFNVDDAVFGIAHEFVHTLGPLDGPPDLSADGVCTEYDDQWCEQRYYYGNLNALCQHYTPGKGIPPIGDPWLATLPWHERDDFTGECRFRQKVYALRDGGDLYRFSIGDYDGLENNPEEYFLMAYHPETEGILVNEEGSYNAGLAIWHCVGTTMFDLESAIGLWDYADEQTQFEYPWNLGELNPNEEAGYDNHDIWFQSPTGTNRSSAEYGAYVGSKYDFFKYLPGQGADPHDRDEFSFRTNPSSSGYTTGPSETFLRRRIQNVPSGLYVKIRGEGTDAGGDYLEVDLLSAPADRVTMPDGDETFTSLVPGEISWDDELLDHYSKIDIWFSNDGGRQFTIQLANDLPAVPMYVPWQWTISPGQGTTAGKIMVVFDNEGDFRYNGYAISDGLFTVNTSITVSEPFVSPQDGDAWYEHSSHAIRWENFWTDCWSDPNPPVVELSYRRVGEAFWMDYGAPLDYEVQPLPEDGITSTITVPHEMALPGRVELRLKFEYRGVTGYAQLDGSIVVYPVDVLFVDRTEFSGVDYENVVPSGGLSLEISGDGRPDLLVTTAETPSVDSDAIFYRNDTEFTNQPRFSEFSDFAQGAIPPEGALGATAARLEGQRDVIFVPHQELSGVRLLRYNGVQYENVANDDNWIDNRNLAPSTCAAWWDIDQDGKLDLHVGRGGLDGNLAYDALYKNHLNTVGVKLRLVTNQAFGPRNERSIVWYNEDKENDDCWDVFVGGNDLTWFEQSSVGSWTFNSKSLPGNPSNPSGWGSTALGLIDSEPSGDGADLVLAGQDGVVTILHNEANESFVDQQIGVTGFASRSLGVQDIDLDGRPDIVVGGLGANVGARVYRNLIGLGYEKNYDDYTSGYGLNAEYGPVAGVSIADYDHDRDFDLVFARESEEGRVYASADAPGRGSLRWLQVDLNAESPYNSESIGATVTVTDAATAEILGRQTIDSGASNRSPMRAPLIFGLGDYADSVRVKVHWRHLRTATVTVAPGIDQVTLTAPAGLNLVSGTVGFELVVEPNSISWAFTWDSDHWSDPALDNVDLTAVAGSGCGFQSMALGAGGEGESSVELIEVDGIRRYRHTVTLHNAPCYPNCRFNYVVSSRDDARDEEFVSGSYLGRMPKLCPSSQ